MNKRVAIILSILIGSTLTQANTLDPSKRASLRYHLENLSNEVELLIKNQKVDKQDIQRQEREFKSLKVFERIPFQRDIMGLKKNLQETSAPFHLEIVDFKWFNSSIRPKNPPDHLYTDEPEFHFSQDQLVETLHFRLIVLGNEDAIKNWVRSWPTDQLRLTQLDFNNEVKSLHPFKKGRWEIRAHAFRFRDVKFPRLLPRNPKNLLPRWAKKNPKLFSKSEPELWSFVTRIENLTPKAATCYTNRERFLLNDARMHFFLFKALKP